MAFAGPIEDRLAVRELLETYAGAVTYRNVEEWSACWSEDSEWLMPDLDVRLSGKADIVSTWVSLMAEYHGPADDPWPFSFISIPCAMAIAGDEGEVSSISVEAFVDASGNTVHLKGEYRDRVVRKAGQWLFRSRSWRLMPIEDAKAFLSN